MMQQQDLTSGQSSVPPASRARIWRLVLVEAVVVAAGLGLLFAIGLVPEEPTLALMRW